MVLEYWHSGLFVGLPFSLCAQRLGTLPVVCVGPMLFGLSVAGWTWLALGDALVELEEGSGLSVRVSLGAPSPLSLGIIPLVSANGFS